MNHSLASESRHIPWFHIVVSVWLFALSIGLVVVTLDVVSLDIPPEPSPQAGPSEALVARLGQVEQQLAAIMRRTPPVTPETLAETRKALETRLTQIETSLVDQSTQQSLLALQSRVDKLESSPPSAITNVVAPTSRSSSTSTKPPKAPRPPFQVMGIELRGGERFLTVAPPGATSMSQIHLMRVGESEGNWMLESIGTKQATFRVKSKTLKLVVP